MANPGRGAEDALGALLVENDELSLAALECHLLHVLVRALAAPVALDHGDDRGRHCGPDGNRVLDAAGCAGEGGRGDLVLRLLGEVVVLGRGHKRLEHLDEHVWVVIRYGPAHSALKNAAGS